MDQHAIIIADHDGVIRLWSEGAERLTGHSAVYAVGQKLDLIVAEELRAQHWAGFGKVSGSTTGQRCRPKSKVSTRPLSGRAIRRCASASPCRTIGSS